MIEGDKKTKGKRIYPPSVTKEKTCPAGRNILDCRGRLARTQRANGAERHRESDQQQFT